MGGMMGGFGGGFSLIGMLLNLVITIAVIGGLVWLVIWAVRQFSANDHSSSLFGQQNILPPARETPREIVEKRYARGEITREQYQEMLVDLS